MPVVTALGGKIIGALILLIVTFLATILPYKLKHLTTGDRCIKNVSCFCGGVSDFTGIHTNGEFSSQRAYYSRQSFWSAIFFTFYDFLTAVKRWKILTRRSLSHFVYN